MTARMSPYEKKILLNCFLKSHFNKQKWFKKKTTKKTFIRIRRGFRLLHSI